MPLHFLLVDTGAIFALVDADDRNHAAAKAFVGQLRSNSVLLVSDVILLEAMTLIKSRLGEEAVVQTLQILRQSRRFQLTQLTRREWADTWAIFERFTDKEWSPFDCSCLAVARARGIGSAFAFDHHFRQMAAAGLMTVP